MTSQISLGRLWGIPIGLHSSWFLVFTLVTFSLAAGVLPAEYPDLSPAAYWLIGAVTSLLFFGSVLIHELAHAVVARRNQIAVRGITLFMFGGVAEIEQEPRTPGAEFRIAIAGPLASIALSIFFELLWVLDRGVSVLAAPSLWLARINLTLALFNMIPGFPLDGGRVLRAIAWKISGNMLGATRLAAGIGQMVAFGFIGLGLFAMLTGGFLNGLWLIFIGWYLQNAASSSVAQANIQQKLSGATVEQAMSRDVLRVSGQVPLRHLVDRFVLPGAARAFLVSGGDTAVDGMVTITDIRAVPSNRWADTTAAQIMTPWARLIQVSPNTDLLDALRTMERANVRQVPVVESSRIVGLLSRENVVQYLRLRSELGV